jgi:energy-coupling factor transporter ATP-binding protein EcfA2
MPPLVVITGLGHSFPDGWDALNGISLTIGPGEYLALIGPNGSGKTTLAKHLNGLLKPTVGRVMVAGNDTRSASVALLARHVGYVFQNPDHQIFSPSVREELSFGPRVQGVAPGEAERRVEEEMAALGLAGLAERPPAILPAGLRRRVAIASVLTARPDLLILDEPNAGLDVKEQEDVFRRVSEYNTAGHAVVLISHDMHLVARWASRCLLLSQGSIIADSTPSAVLGDTGIIERAGMRPPMLAQLTQALAPYGMTTAALSVPAVGDAYLSLLGAKP